MQTDIADLLGTVFSPEGKRLYRDLTPNIVDHCERFLASIEEQDYEELLRIPVFIDWNIGNFSMDENNTLHSRWDYDWFRMAPRVMDFYFFARVVSDAGDRTDFSYTTDPLNEDRFKLFLKTYHQHYPLERKEILFLKEGYRFFILNYVIRYGHVFFRESYARKLQKEAFDVYLPKLDTEFDPSHLLATLDL
jgi:hypothetical protein